MDIVTAFAPDYSWLAIDAAIVIAPVLAVMAAVWLVVVTLRGIWRGLRRLARSRRPAVVAAAEALASPRESQPRLASATQWSRVTGVVTAGLDRAHAATTFHGRASNQVDAALYGLQRLGAELRGVVAARQPSHAAEVHVLRARRAGHEKPDKALAA